MNRAHVMQRHGVYPPPPGASELPGLEASGRVAAMGPGLESSDLSIGDEVCALLSGGGYAEYVVVPIGQVLPVPEGMSVSDAAALPEVGCTVWSNLVLEAGLGGRRNRSGPWGFQWYRHDGDPSGCIPRGPRDCDCRIGRETQSCSRTGRECADQLSQAENFTEAVLSATEGRGVDVILDVVGATYLESNVRVLAPDRTIVS